MPNNLIKGYLPVQIVLPSPRTQNGKDAKSVTENTFIFVKQHVSSSTESLSSSSARTIFVTNTPIYPSIRTNILLTSIFERYGDVEKIVVAPKPQRHVTSADGSSGGNANQPDGGQPQTSANELSLAMFEREIRNFGGSSHGMALDERTWYDQGRYAHVVFATNKDMKKFMNRFSSSSKKTKSKNDVNDAVVTFGKLEIQELQDASTSLYLKERKKFLKQADEESSDESEQDEDEHEERPNGIMALLQAHRDKILPRASLKNMCDQIMVNFEEKEAEALRQQQIDKEQPDEDGFVTVSYSASVGDRVDFEENGTLGSTGRRKRERNRSERKNIVKGSAELSDFYRFQLKASKKRRMGELKERFQEDLKRVKQMKEDKMYRPF